MFGDEKRQGIRQEDRPEPVESLATIIPRLLALRGLAPTGLAPTDDVASTSRAKERTRPVETARVIVGGRPA
jgi:hypothetical protein